MQQSAKFFARRVGEFYTVPSRTIRGPKWHCIGVVMADITTHAGASTDLAMVQIQTMTMPVLPSVSPSLDIHMMAKPVAGRLT